MHVFCSVMQLKAWYELVECEVEDIVKKEDVIECNYAWNRKTTVFKWKLSCDNISQLPRCSTVTHM